ncbi:class I SAM-dependent methyltransferase [Aurantiacibacter poecillastricola]|uniref:class I SAM-dependent methyltransferase n=1 Tax=Aurantiacibacter poecillastricola TaxID=3064385 RepID=UPI00273DC5D1|nr:class I SAM-dependent methyltransferase [Aurantiacibacter sp. 219JJ12-13]MDP5260016.1 class I SAM-dependent methyltransferase [Aurantiacibacter sp. 219JJ12-13]
MGEHDVASTYQGEKGEAYFEGRGQDKLLHLGYHLQAAYYLPHLSREMDVLDFGCGNGSMAAVLRDHVASIEGLEVNDKPRELARETFGLTVYDKLAAIPDDKRYDAIVSNHVIEHVPHPIEVLQMLGRHLKPGGKLVIMVPIEDFRARRNADWKAPDINQHLHTWAPLQFANTLREAGFTPQVVDVVNSAWSPKLFFLGKGMLQSLAGRLLATVTRRRQILAVATKG